MSQSKPVNIRQIGQAFKPTIFCRRWHGDQPTCRKSCDLGLFSGEGM